MWKLSEIWRKKMPPDEKKELILEVLQDLITYIGFQLALCLGMDFPLKITQEF